MSILFTIFLAISISETFNELKDKEWKNFKQKFSKSYPTKLEERRRKRVFMKNLSQINRINRNFEQGRASFKGKVYKWNDLTKEEFIKTELNKQNERYVFYPHWHNNSNYNKLPSVRFGYPSVLDLRLTDEIGAVKHQGDCGSCWAFTAATCLRSCLWRRYSSNFIYDASVQLLLGCVYPRNGCFGGRAASAFIYMDELISTCECTTSVFEIVL